MTYVIITILVFIAMTIHLHALVLLLLVLYGLLDLNTQGDVDRDFILLPLKIHLLLLGADVGTIGNVEHHVDLSYEPALRLSFKVDSELSNALQVLKRSLKLILLVRHVDFVLAHERPGQEIAQVHPFLKVFPEGKVILHS